MLGRRYEYLDPEQTIWASDRGAGPLGFAGTATKAGTQPATGLATLAGDTFGGGPRIPMVPGSWQPEGG
ncbi:putative PPE family protein PPE3 [Mycobacterium talmoniae]|nr:putative PPE family protein PPE3 [Mycobacterium talmoniae]